MMLKSKRTNFFQAKVLHQHVEGSVTRVLRSFSLATKATFNAGQPTPETHPELLSTGELMPGISAPEFALRRQKLRSALPKGSLVILGSAMVKHMTDSVPYPYRQDADYLYFTGCQQPGGIAITDDYVDLCMFMPVPDPEREIWDGHVAGPHEALTVFGADQAYSIKRIHEFLPEMIRRAKVVLFDPIPYPSILGSLSELKEVVQNQKFENLRKYTHNIRWVKSKSEIDCMRGAAAITSQAFMQAMLVSKHCQHERILAATVEYECKIRGAQRMSFPSVVGGGENATVIHYSRNDQQIKEGDMVLMDAGCELHGYVSDLTRTWPPSGRFSPEQKEVYEIVLEAMKECFKLCQPSVTLQQLHLASGLILAKGLAKLGILQDGNNVGQDYLKFNPSLVGHYVGMDVHDCAAIKGDVPLQPGVVITIEPALYIPVMKSVPEKYQGLGVRIEDEVLITPSGCEVLTAAVPKEVDEVESWMSQGWTAMRPWSSSLKSYPIVSK